jgi:DNA-binding transcriptional MerR regulator
MELREDIAEKLKQLQPTKYSQFPDIELYMDQVLECLSRGLSFGEDDKLTSAMVNNYIKAGLLPRAAGKKYSKKHLVHLTIISRLKQVLSVKSIGELLKATKKDRPDEDYYSEFCDMVSQSAQDVAEELKTSGDELPELAFRLAVDSYIKKAVSEYIINLTTEKLNDKSKTKK